MTGGILWGAINVGAGRILQFVSTVILARILAPEHFGALAIALVVQTIAANMSELGATAAIGRADRAPEKIAPTVFTFSLLSSTFFAGAVAYLAPPLAALMGDPSAAPVIQVMSITIFLGGCSGVPAAMVWREYLQRPRAIVEVTGAVVALVAVIPMALGGWGAFALVWSRVLGQIVVTVGYWIITPQRFGLGFDRSVAAHVLRIGLPLAAANLVVYATLNLDYVLIGRQLGAAELGVYLLAFSLASLPSNLITAVIRTVAVPTFGRLHAAGTLGAKAPIFLSATSYLSMPVSALLVALAAPLIAVLYGDVWAGAAPAMIGLGVFGAGRILTETLADLCVGAGRTGMLLWIQVAWFAALLPALVLGIQHGGIVGVGIGHAVVMWALVVPLYVACVTRMLRTDLRTIIRRSGPAFLAAAVAGAAAWIISMMIPTPILALLIGGVVGLVIYVLLVFRPVRALVPEIRSFMNSPATHDAGESGAPADARHDHGTPAADPPVTHAS